MQAQKHRQQSEFRNIKMAYVVGVPKRDPCQKCKLPVFLAERLAVGKKIYHRTCLKCARCGSQLSPGSFYETEIDDEYCCETCPDEESDFSTEQLSSSSPKAHDNGEATSIPVLRSIGDRLSFFEQNSSISSGNNSALGNKVSQKNISDEEKSQSLKHVEVTPYKMSSEFSNFINNSYDGSNDEDTESETNSSKYAGLQSETQTCTSDKVTDVAVEKEDDMEEPELRKAQSQTVKHIAEEKVNRRFTTTAHVNLIAAECVDNNIESNNRSEMAIVDNGVNRDDRQEATGAETVKSHNNAQNILETNLELSPTTNDNDITKDTSVNSASPEHASNRHSVEDKNTIETENIIDVKKEFDISTTSLKSNMKMVEEQDDKEQPEDVETTKRLSVVRARLQQFEECINNDKPNIIISPNKTTTPISIEIEHDKDVSIKVHVDETDEEIKRDDLQDAVKTEDLALEMQNNDNKQEDVSEVPLTAINIDDFHEVDVKNEIINLEEVPLESKAEESNEEIVNKGDIPLEVNKQKEVETLETTESPAEKSVNKTNIEEYPEDLNPFKSDDEDETELSEENKENVQKHSNLKTTVKSNASLNPFDSSDDDIELEKSPIPTTASTPSAKVPPPRPPPPRISKNPFGDESDEPAEGLERHSSLTSSFTKKTPVPTPRTNLSQSQNPTPEPTPRLGNKTTTAGATQNLAHNSSDFYGSVSSLISSPPSLQHASNSEVRGSNNSLASSSAGNTIRGRKSRRAPAPPVPVMELFVSSETINSSKTSTPSSSTVGTPKASRKKRPAPAPPKPARLEASSLSAGYDQTQETNMTPPKNLLSYPPQSELLSQLSDEEKALLEGKVPTELDTFEPSISARHCRRLIPLDASLLEEDDGSGKCDDVKQQRQHVSEQEEANVVYRRLIIPPSMDTPTKEADTLLDDLNYFSHTRQLEKLKDNKEAKNRNRQSQMSVSSGAEDSDAAPCHNKSMHGKWKRRKGPAPALPVPPRRVLQMLPLQEIRHELEIIEVQQQGLEKQGVVLEKMIRDRCEGQKADVPPAESGIGNEPKAATETEQNSKEVEDLILQLFELVNEKNELFRRQAELMYLRRQHRLEQEQADLEYEIRVLMAQPERNKTDSDKAREETLIARLIEVVQLRNEVVDCLEMDRLREAEEDLSIKERLELHTAEREKHEEIKKPSGKLSKKEKKKQKETKKLSKSKNIDMDKDADEKELKTTEKEKKKKKIFVF